MKYLYNTGSGKLHIYKGCAKAESDKGVGIKCYDTYEEALKNEGISMSFCRDCDRKRESILTEYFKNK